MLQPMQPIGGQKPGQNMASPQGMPKAPGQQTMPAGAALQRGILPGGIASNPEDIKAAYGGTPQGQQKLQQAAQQGDYLSAIALNQILEEEREKAAAKAAEIQQQGGKPPSIVDQKRQEAVELRKQDLQDQQVKRLGMEQQRSQQAMAQMVGQSARPQPQGIAGLPAQNVAQPQAMAAGGIVAFDDGGSVNPPTNQPQADEQTINEIMQRNPGITRDEAVRLAMGQGLGAPRPVGKPLGLRQLVEQTGRGMVGRDPRTAEIEARENYMRYGGFSPEEKAAQEKRIANLEKFDEERYNPEELRTERLFRSLSAARGMSGSDALGNYGIASSNYRDKMRELERQKLIDRQKKAEEFAEAQRGARIKGYEAGTQAGKGAREEQLGGMRELGDLAVADVNLAARLGAGGGAGNRATEDALQRAAADPQIRELTKFRTENNYQPGTEEWDRIQKMIEDRTKAIFKSFPGAVYPEYAEMAPVPEKPKEDGFWSGIFSNVSKAMKPSGQSSKPNIIDYNSLP